MGRWQRAGYEYRIVQNRLFLPCGQMTIFNNMVFTYAQVTLTSSENSTLLIACIALQRIVKEGKYSLIHSLLAHGLQRSRQSDRVSGNTH